MMKTSDTKKASWVKSPKLRIPNSKSQVQTSPKLRDPTPELPELWTRLETWDSGREFVSWWPWIWDSRFKRSDSGFGVQPQQPANSVVKTKIVLQNGKYQFSFRENTILLVGDDIVLFWKISARHHPLGLHSHGAWPCKEIQWCSLEINGFHMEIIWLLKRNSSFP